MYVDRNFPFTQLLYSGNVNSIIAHLKDLMDNVNNVEADITQAKACHELMCIRDGIFSSPLTPAQCNELLKELCI